LTTGYSDRITAIGSKGFPMLRKPYRMETLAVAVDEALAMQRRHSETHFPMDRH